MSRLIHIDKLILHPRTNKPIATGQCRRCERRAVTFAYSGEGYADNLDGLIPVCRTHLLVYRVTGGLWQAEDEYAGLLFARRSRWRWLAQRRLLHDQRAAVAGRVSRAQRWRSRNLAASLSPSSQEK